MKTCCLLATLTTRWLRCAPQFLLIMSILVTGVSPFTAFAELVGSEETDSPCEEKEQEQKREQEEKEQEEIARSFDLRKRYLKGNLRGWYHGDPRLPRFSTLAHRFQQGHCLPNGLRAPLLR